MKRWQLILLVIIGVVVIAGAGYLGYQRQSQSKEETKTASEPPTVEVTRGDVKQTIISPGRLVNYKTIGITAGTSGTVLEINVRPGEYAKEGDVLVLFGNRDQLESAVASAQIAKISAEQTLNDIYTYAPLKEAQAQQAIAEAQQEVINKQYKVNALISPPNAIDLAAAQSKVVILAEQLKQAENRYQSYFNKSDDNVIKAQLKSAWAAAQKEYSNAVRELNYLTGSPSTLTQLKTESELSIAEANLSIKQAAYDALENGINLDDLARSEANLKRAELDLVLAVAELESVELKAPFDGIVLSVNAQEGNTVSKGQEIIKYADPMALEVLTSIIEEDYPLIKVGQNAELYFDAAPGVQAYGSVERIIPKRISEDRPLYQVFLSLDENPEGVVEGMTVDISIILDSQSEVLRLPRALVRASSDGTAQVSVWENGQEEVRNITVGLRGDLFIEIVDGLEIGDKVVGQ